MVSGSLSTNGTGNWVGTATLTLPVQADNATIINKPMHDLSEYFILGIVTCLISVAYS